MGQQLKVRYFAGVCVVAFLAGCSSIGRRPIDESPRLSNSPSSAKSSASIEDRATALIRLASHVEPADPLEIVHATPANENLFDGMKELSAEALVENVLARNPTVAKMSAALEAAVQRYPQARALDDPMFSSWMAPQSIQSNQVDFSFRVELSQKFPIGHKRKLKGQAASAEASAASHDLDDARVQLRETAKLAFYEYYLVNRALEVNQSGLELLGRFKKNASDRYRTGQSAQSDVSLAEVEIGKQQERQVTLERMRNVAVARINTLLWLPVDNKLPPAPAKLNRPGGLPSAEVLADAAIESRPDLKALADRVAVEQATYALATKEYLPDVEMMAAFDNFWQTVQSDLWTQLGMRINVPAQLSRRRAAVAEARAKIAERRAELDRQSADVRLQVREKYEETVESARILDLYEKSILRSAEEGVRTAESAYTTGQTPFVSLVEAQRNQIMLKDRYFEALADALRRQAALERAVGGPLPTLPTAPEGAVSSWRTRPSSE